MSNDLGYNWQDQDNWSRGGEFRSILRSQHRDLFPQTLAVAEVTTDVTVSTASPATQAVWGPVRFVATGQPVVIEISGSSGATGNGAGEFLAFYLFLDDSAANQEICVIQANLAAAGTARAPIYGRYRYKPTPGNHTVEVRVCKLAVDGTLYATSRVPLLLTVTSDPTPRT